MFDGVRFWQMNLQVEDIATQFASGMYSGESGGRHMGMCRLELQMDDWKFEAEISLREKMPEDALAGRVIWRLFRHISGNTFIYIYILK